MSIRVRRVESTKVRGEQATSQESPPGFKNESEINDFDDIVSAVGSQGKYQRFLLYAVLCPITTVEPIFTLNAIFMLFEPDHWCHVPGRNGTDLNLWKNMTVPWEDGPDGNMRLSQCHMFNDTGGRVECTDGWEYDTTDYSHTIPGDFNWVCSRSHYSTDAFTAMAVGNAVGTIIFGYLADKIGRKPIFFLTCLINICFRVVSLFIPQYFFAFLGIQFLIGTAFPMMFITLSMIAAEISDKEYRAWIYAVCWMIWVVGMASLPLIAWLCRNWFLIGVVTSVPGILLFLYYKWIPESPRWLCSVGRTEEAKKVLLDIAEANGTTHVISEEKLDILLKQLAMKSESQASVGTWTLFSRKRLAKNTIMLCASWSMNALIYYGITLNSTQMSGNQFVNFFLLAIIEIPAGYLGGILAEKFGRRWTQVGFFVICGLACIVAGIGVPYPYLFYLIIIAVITAKFAITLTFLVVYLQGTEIFPTMIRSTGSGFAATISSIIGTLGPYIVFIGKFHVGAPYFAMAGLSIIGLIASAFLPETLGVNLPETIEEANDFGKNDKFWSLTPNKEIPNNNEKGEKNPS